jgi:hypothetical protein
MSDNSLNLNNPTNQLVFDPQLRIKNLLVIDSGMVGSHDLWWAESEDMGAFNRIKGYNIYRAFDHPSNWEKLNATPWLGHFYRDMTTLTQVLYTVQPTDFIEKGEVGQWVIRIPDVPYTTVRGGQVNATNSPDDVQVMVSVSGNFAVDGQTLRPTQVNAFDRTVTMLVDNTLKQGGAVSDTALVHTDNVSIADYNGITAWQVVYNKLTNYVDIYHNLNRTYYTVVPVTDKGELHAPGAPHTEIRNTQEVDQIDWVFEEMVRRNEYLFNTTGEPASILFRKWRGERCGCVFGSEQPKTGCPSCFETGFVGGYIGPYDFIFVPPDSAISRELDEGGIKTTRTSRSYMTRTPIIQNGDLIVRASGDRMVVSDVVYKSPRGIILQQDFTVQLLPKGDTRYLIPIFNTGLPTIRNPIVRHDALDGTKAQRQPVFDPRTVPQVPGGKQWENPNPQIGKTVEFGKIQT